MEGGACVLQGRCHLQAHPLRTRSTQPTAGGNEWRARSRTPRTPLSDPAASHCAFASHCRQGRGECRTRAALATARGHFRLGNGRGQQRVSSPQGREGSPQCPSRAPARPRPRSRTRAQTAAQRGASSGSRGRHLAPARSPARPYQGLHPRRGASHPARTSTHASLMRYRVDGRSVQSSTTSYPATSAAALADDTCTSCATTRTPLFSRPAASASDAALLHPTAASACATWWCRLAPRRLRPRGRVSPRPRPRGTTPQGSPGRQRR